jgi:hypothetical protein
MLLMGKPDFVNKPIAGAAGLKSPQSFCVDGSTVEAVP